MNSIVKLKNIEQWEGIRNDLLPVEELIIFKYSPVCSISSMVEEDFNLWYSKLPDESKLKFVKVNVIEAKDVSRKIAEDLKLKHESPQLIWLRGNSEIKWAASHFDITVDELKAHQ
ncbi:MAG: bacillithiol system redox-active protein YtxJ [Bacteroidetes bacterium]|nr:bacillithiol system redox-active protein YtxJ [Bacteroidota bacterium]